MSDAGQHAVTRSTGTRSDRLLVAIVAVVAGTTIGLMVAATSNHPARQPSGHALNRDKAITTASTPPPGYALRFDGTFGGSALDTSIWGTCYPSLSALGCTNFGNPQEVEWYVPSQASVAGGALRLSAVAIPTPGFTRSGGLGIYPYRSGMVTTFPSFRFTYGYIEMVARLPTGQQFWPALWLLPVDGSNLPEIDIAESASNNPRSVGVFLHPAGAPSQGYVVPTANLSVGWHTFALDWRPHSLTWFVDGQPVFTSLANIPNVPMYALITLAATNYVAACLNDAPPACNGSLVVKSLRIWQSP